jgi:ribosome maturation factor RimP
MIEVKKIEEILNPFLDERDFFLVSCKVTSTNKITIEVDAVSGFNVAACVEVSRFLEEALDRDNEDFELEVASPGADKPLLLPKQYIKNIGRTLKVTLNDNKKFEAELTNADNQSASFYYKEKVKVEGKKSKQTVEHNLTIPYQDINEAKVVIKFK